MRYGHISCVTGCTRDMLSTTDACITWSGLSRSRLWPERLPPNMPSFVELTSLVPATAVRICLLDPVRCWDAYYVFCQYLTGVRMIPIYEDCWYHRACETFSCVNRLWHGSR